MNVVLRAAFLVTIFLQHNFDIFIGLNAMKLNWIIQETHSVTRYLTVEKMSDQKRLKLAAQAAEALVEAAALESNIVSGLEKLDQNLSDKINTVNQNIANLSEAVKKSNELLERDWKQRRLEFALNNTTISSFSYLNAHHSFKDSRELVKGILVSFITGYPQYLPKGAYIMSDKRVSRYDNPTDDEMKVFRETLKSQLWKLIGREPRLYIDNGKYAVAYS